MTQALLIEGLQKTYANGFTALKGIDLSVNEGDFFGLLGPNGAGKSTTIGVICSLINKSAGRVRVFGVDIDQDFPRAKHFIGVVPQEFNFNQFERVRDIVVTQAGYYGLSPALGLARAEKYLRHLDLWDKRDVQSRRLSGGMKRRLMIARALVHEPRLLILDEPTAGVDIELRRSMWQFLRRINNAGTTIILTTHYLEEAESLCRNIAIIDHGELVENTATRELLKKLHTETFILDTESPVPAQVEIPGYPVRVVDSNCLEISVDKGHSLNDVFAKLGADGIQVTSMRNKANRLEELFLMLVREQAGNTEQQVVVEE